MIVHRSNAKDELNRFNRINKLKSRFAAMPAQSSKDFQISLDHSSTTFTCVELRTKSIVIRFTVHIAVCAFDFVPTL